MITRAIIWMGNAPKHPQTHKISLEYLYAECRRYGYCICPKPLRALVDFTGLNCTNCGMPEKQESRDFWYEEIGDGNNGK